MGQAAGREEAATCCHGSEPTYRHRHHSLTRPRCLVAWKELRHGSVGWAAERDGSWKPEPPDLATSPDPPSSPFSSSSGGGSGLRGAWASSLDIQSPSCGARAPGSQQASSPTPTWQPLLAYLSKGGDPGSAQELGNPRAVFALSLSIRPYPAPHKCQRLLRVVPS